MSKRMWLGAFAASTLAIGWVNHRIKQWETLTPHDANDGEFYTLSDGARMHFTRCGTQGRSVMLIHGFLGSSYDWFRNVPALTRDYRTWAVDLVGFGYSERVTQRTYSLKAYARSVRELMDAQGIERAALVGHSMGGAIALEFAHDYPDRVDQLVLIAPATYLARIPTLINLAMRVPILPRAIIGSAVTSPYVRSLTWRAALGSSHIGIEKVETNLRALHLRGTTDALIALIGSQGVSDLVQGIGNIAQPALVIAGEQDLVVPAWYCRQVARRLPNARLVTIQGAGHVPHIEFPDVVNRLVLDFLSAAKIV